MIRSEVEESRLITARINTSQTISYGNEYGSYQVRGVMPNYFDIENLIIAPEDGRFINQLDMKESNKVIVLDKKVADLLFKDESPLGKQVKVGQIMFKVVGSTQKKNNGEDRIPTFLLPPRRPFSIPTGNSTRSPLPWTDW